MPFDHRPRDLGLFNRCEAVVPIVVLGDLVVSSVAGEAILLCLEDGRLLDFGNKGNGGSHDAIAGRQMSRNPVLRRSLYTLALRRMSYRVTSAEQDTWSAGSLRHDS